MTLSEAIPSLVTGKQIKRKSDPADRAIHHDKKTRKFVIGIQGVPDVLSNRCIDFSIDDLRATDWEVCEVHQ